MPEIKKAARAVRSIIIRFVLVALIFALMCGFAIVLTTGYRQASVWIIHTHLVLESLSELQGGMLAAESAARGYVITGDAKFYEQAGQGAERARARLAEVRRLTSDNPTQQERVDALGKAMEPRLILLGKLMQERHDSGTTAVTAQQGSDVMDEVARTINIMAAEEYRLLDGRNAVFFAQLQRLNWTMLGGSIGAMVLLGTCVVALMQERARRTLIEQNYRARSEQLCHFIKLLPVPVAIFNRDMLLLEASNEWFRRFGYKRENVIGYSAYAFFPNMPEHWRTQHAEVLKGNKVVQHDDVYVAPDGKPHIVNRILLPLRRGENIDGLMAYTEFKPNGESAIAQVQKLHDIATDLHTRFEGLLDEATGTDDTATDGR